MKIMQNKLDWIKANGSRRLKRLVEEGIEHNQVYMDEWLTKERPGWRWSSTTPGFAEFPGNYPEEAFDILDEARKLEPKAKLCYWVIEHSCSDECYWCGKVYVWRGYAAVANIDGEDIIFGVPMHIKSYKDMPN